jgi:hypothetical protein
MIEEQNGISPKKVSDPVGGQNGTNPKKVRGRAQWSLDLIDAMYVEAEKAQPITGRGIGYKLFVRKLIPSMSDADMKKVYRLLKEAREEGTIPWEWIVDESRALERTASWDNPSDYADAVISSYRRDYWKQQPVRVELWTEKGTVRGVCRPVLNEYGIGFRNVHGFSGATTAHDVAQDDDGRQLIILYIGDFDPSGMCMSEHDLPNRFQKYGGDHIELKRIALLPEHVLDLPSFPASDKKKDTRHGWFTRRYGDQCWELDALDPNALREMVEAAILEHIEPMAWARCKTAEKAERESIQDVVGKWKDAQDAASGDGWGWREAQ